MAAVNPFVAGAASRCPHCGDGPLFDGFIKVKARCAACDFDLGAADSGDGPAVFIILIVGFLACFGVLFTAFVYRPPAWLNLLIWLPAGAILALGLLRPLKGLMIAMQFHNQASEARHEPK